MLTLEPYLKKVRITGPVPGPLELLAVTDQKEVPDTSPAILRLVHETLGNVTVAADTVSVHGVATTTPVAVSVPVRATTLPVDSVKSASPTMLRRNQFGDAWSNTRCDGLDVVMALTWSVVGKAEGCDALNIPDAGRASPLVVADNQVDTIDAICD